MTTPELAFNPHDRNVTIGLAVPAKIVPIIDRLAAENFVSRSCWVRRTLMQALQREVIA